MRVPSDDDDLTRLTAKILMRLRELKDDPDSADEREEMLSRLKAELTERSRARPTVTTGDGAYEPGSCNINSFVGTKLVGDVVIAAAAAEDAAGMLVQAASQDWRVRAAGYGATSGKLLKALKAIVPDDLYERFDAAMHLRHQVVHGQAYPGSSWGLDGDGMEERIVFSKRDYMGDTPDRSIKALTLRGLSDLAREFWLIEDQLEMIHTEMLGIDTSTQAPDIAKALSTSALTIRHPPINKQGPRVPP